jgi:CheY-like chemotaxis protein
MIELRKERIELAPILEQAVAAARPLVDAMQHALEVQQPPEPIHLDADPVRLAQIVGNLLNNASKFMDPGGRITLSAEREGEQATIRVSDDGIGIAPEHLPNIFKMFMQVDSSLERSVGGLGIGLTLVENLVRLHGGTVEAYSAGLARGSEFVVRLPIAAGASRPGRRPEDGSPAARAASGRRILVVDDNEDGAQSLAMVLNLNAHETQLVHDGEAAIAAAERFRPDVVLLDIGLPLLNGYEVCRRIRQQSWGRNLFLVAMTGWGQEEDRQRSTEAGFDAHLVKPVNLDALTKLLTSLPARSRE